MYKLHYYQWDKIKGKKLIYLKEIESLDSMQYADKEFEGSTKLRCVDKSISVTLEPLQDTIFCRVDNSLLESYENKPSQEGDENG